MKGEVYHEKAHWFLASHSVIRISVCYGSSAMASAGGVSVEEEAYGVCPLCGSIAEYIGSESGPFFVRTMPGTPCPTHGSAHCAEGMYCHTRDNFRCFAYGYYFSDNYGEVLMYVMCPLGKK